MVVDTLLTSDPARPPQALLMRIDWPQIGVHLVHLLQALLLALSIGWDREQTARSVVLRIFPLVAIVADVLCIFMALAQPLRPARRKATATTAPIGEASTRVAAAAAADVIATAKRTTAFPSVAQAVRPDMVLITNQQIQLQSVSSNTSLMRVTTILSS